MPFPYAYYKEEYNGPLHGTELLSPLLLIDPPASVATSDIIGGVLDVTGKSSIALSASAGDILISNITGGKSGQLLFIKKGSQVGTITFAYNNSGEGEIVTAARENLVLGNGRYGGACFMCSVSGGITSWYHLDNSGLFANGSALNPSISFGSDPDTGIFNKTANVLAVSTAGVERMNIGIATIASLIPHRFADGSPTVPSISFNDDLDTGFYKTLNTISLSMDGIHKIQFNKSGSIGMESPYFRADLPYEFTTSDANVPQQVRAGSLVVSNIAGANALLPANGIYSLGNVRTSGQFIGTATSALYADLAEMYESDADYAPGTLVKIGGQKEMTIASTHSTFGVVSTNPGFLLNAGKKEGIHLPVALAGKVPCRIIGKVEKGDAVGLHPSIPGVAAAGYEPKIGRALEDKHTEEEGLVMIVTRAVI